MKRDTVVIIGAGFAGMLSAAMLAHHFKQVVMIEKFPEVSQGVAQAPHLHVLLKQGQLILENYFPGILEQMRSHGCQEVDWAADTVWYSPFGAYPRFRSGIVTVNCSRLLLDRLMRERLQHFVNVRVEYQAALKIDTEQADFFIDARGRTVARTRHPRESGDLCTGNVVVSNTLAYATQFYQLPHNHHSPFKQIYVPAYAGINDRGCVISPIEENKVVVTLIGSGDARSGKNQEQFKQHIAQINNQAVTDFLQHAIPISDIKLFTDLNNEHRKLGKIKDWPDNVVVIGDAACKINPIYGQGMMLAAKQVAMLEKHLVNHSTVNTRRIQKKIDKIVRFSWLMATTEDKRAYPNKKLTLRFLHFCLDKLYQLCVRSEKIHLQFLKILHGLSI